MLMVNNVIIITLDFIKYLYQLEQQPEAKEPEQKHECGEHLIKI